MNTSARMRSVKKEDMQVIRIRIRVSGARVIVEQNCCAKCATKSATGMADPVRDESDHGEPDIRLWQISQLYVPTQI